MFTFIYLTIFPSYFHNYFQLSLANKILKQKKIKYQVYDLREFADKKQVDDYPYGGGGGMLLKIEPIVKTIKEVQKNHLNSYLVFLTPQGKRITQKDITRLLDLSTNIVFICGHYEGVDSRVWNYIDEQISIGDFITMGGEMPALTITEAMIRAIPGAIKKESYQQESFTNNTRFDFDSYTKPSIFQELSVPEILLSGNHQEIKRWREQNMQLKIKNFKKLQRNKKKITP